MHILWPAFVLFALTAFVLFRLGFMRMAAVREGRVDPHFYRLFRDGKEPEDLAALSRQHANLYEAPVLFYAGVLIAYVTGLQGTLLLALAWSYVGLRLLHCWIHLGSNRVARRFQVFALSWLVLVALWAVLAYGLATAG